MAKFDATKIKMTSPDGYNSFSAEEQQYDADKDGVFEIFAAHEEHAAAHGLVRLAEKKK